MKAFITKTAFTALLLLFTSISHADGIKLKGDFDSKVEIDGEVISAVLGNDNTVGVDIGSARGNVEANNFKSDVNIDGDVITATLGNGNNVGVSIGSASSSTD